MKRYVNGPTCTTIRDLYAENPDLSSRLESFRTNQKDFNGMTFAKYLVSEGLLIEKNITNVYLEGTLHRGIDDAYNIAKIFIKNKDIFMK